MQDPRPIPGFEEYVVDRDGSVYTANRHKPLRISKTQRGSAKVTLYRDGAAYTKSLAKLVAEAHLWNDHDPEVFDTPIHLDNDPMNNHVDNLAWRPRWFAVKYYKQYWKSEYRHATTKVMDVDTGIVYTGLVEPCQTFGILYIDLLQSCTKHTYVFPTWKIFAFA